MIHVSAFRRPSHIGLDATYLYGQANIETKRTALEQAGPAARPGKPPRWKRDAELLAWLDTLSDTVEARRTGSAITACRGIGLNTCYPP